MQLNGQAAACRAQDPRADPGGMETFPAAAGLIFLMSSSKPMDVRMDMMKGMKTMYPGIAVRCAAEPEAKCMGAVGEVPTDAATKE
ncbi:MAG TPA: hypothetical protein VFL16_02215 [Steroidobacteraceae bacterium]|nr:hypothetical protein [Steroidobacteraceae bacterium]